MIDSAEVLERLRGIEEELRDLAYRRLADGGAGAVGEERRIHRARRSLTRAIAILEGTESGDDENA